MLTHNFNQSINRQQELQDHQALLKAKYCPRVAAVSRTEKQKKTPCDLDLDI